MWRSIFFVRNRQSWMLLLNQFKRLIIRQYTKRTFISYSRMPTLVIMNVMMELRNCCNQLFFIHWYEERILSDAVASGSHKSEKEISAIWSKVMSLMVTLLRILTGIQSLQNNLLNLQERFFWQSFQKNCRALGTRSSFSVRWFVSLTFLTIYWASNSPNIKGSMDQSPPHIRTVMLIGFATCCIKGLSWSWEQE